MDQSEHEKINYFFITVNNNKIPIHGGHNINGSVEDDLYIIRNLAILRCILTVISKVVFRISQKKNKRKNKENTFSVIRFRVGFHR